VATPFTADLCGCHGVTGDGCTDLSLKFDPKDLGERLKLQNVAGDTIRLSLPGYLTEQAAGIPSKARAVYGF
jgi:hypothetical protein